jgi:hypothetical protein
LLLEEVFTYTERYSSKLVWWDFNGPFLSQPVCFLIARYSLMPGYKDVDLFNDAWLLLHSKVSMVLNSSVQYDTMQCDRYSAVGSSPQAMDFQVDEGCHLEWEHR